MENEKRAPRGQQVDFLTPEKAPAKIYGVLWWAALYTALTVGAELALDAVWTDRRAHWPAVLLMALLLLGSGAVRRFNPERRHIALRLLPWLDLLVSFLVGSPIAGGADWVNCFLRQWNASHDTLYRELSVSATRWDQTAFLLLILVLLSWFTFFLLRRKRKWLACAYVGIFTVLGFLPGTDRILWFPLLLAGLVGYFLSGKTVQATGRGAIAWGVLLAALLSGLLLPSGKMESVVRLRSDTDRQIHDLRYGPEQLPVGNLYESGKLSGEDEAELEVRADQSKDLYLRSFTGGSYSNGIWEPLPGAAYGGDNTGMFTWLKKQGFLPQTQLSQYEALGDTPPQSNSVQIRVDKASREWYYAPSSLAEPHAAQTRAEKDREPTARGLFGKRSYEYTELSGSRPGELTVPDSWVTNPSNEAQTRYLQAEAVYRNFVYENYTAVDGKLAGLMDVVFHETEPDSDSTFSVLTHIREVLRSRYRYDGEGLEVPAGEEPIAYFLTQSHRGNAAFFASAAVEALRSYGIPARYAEGYRCTEEKLTEAQGSAVTLTGQDRHAWVEIYYDGIGWIPVDVTPGYYYDLVTLQRLVSLPDDVTKTADLNQNDTLANEEPGNDGGAQSGPVQRGPVKLPVDKILAALGILALLAALVLLLAEGLRGAAILVLRRKFRSAKPLERAKRAEKILFAVLSAKGIHAGLGWNTEQLDARLAQTFPKVQSGEYMRVCALLEKAVYGDIPPEVYEERTIQALLRKLNAAVTGSGLRAWLRGRYAWLPAAVR